jgi:EAL and modified HD-GYP domain-containing signal transduction protein
MFSNSEEVFIARQPIFDQSMQVKAYELLFRTGEQNSFDPAIDQDYASKKMMSDVLHLWGMDSLIGSHRAFVNLTEHVLLSEIPFLFDTQRVVIELLETVTPSEEVVQRCAELKARGFTLALDDFEYSSEFVVLFKYIDIIKVDFLISKREDRLNIVQKSKDFNVEFLAEKVETLDEFHWAKEHGFTLFQGYFFSKPEIIIGHDIPANKLNVLEILKEVNQPSMEFKELEKIISRDVSLSYKLMRFINSVGFGLRKKVNSIRHALVLLGEDELKKWVSFMALSEIADNKPNEMLELSLRRSLFLEKLAVLMGLKQGKSDFFLAGLFSMIDGFLDRPMQEILKDLPVSEEVKSVLMGESSSLSYPYHLMLHYEKGEWSEAFRMSRQLRLERTQIPAIYHEASLEAHKMQT